MFAQFLGLLGKNDISEFDLSGNQLITTIDENLNKWRNIRSQLSDLSDEKASKIMVAMGADTYMACWKNTLKEVEQIVKVLEKLRNEYQEINQ
jgi:hypothetical protein